MRIRTLILAVLMMVSAVLGGTATAAGGEDASADAERFAPDSFSFSGGSGKLTITCPEVEIVDGQAWATLVLSSKNYPWVRVDGVQYDAEHPDNNSVVKIPVELNAPVEIVGLTTAMSEPHEIVYTVCVRYGAEEELIPGLTFLEREETEAELLDVLLYEDGYKLVRVAGVGRYLLVPEGGEIPAPLENDMQVIRLPVSGAYVETRELMEQLPEPDAAALAGFEGGEAAFVGAGGELMLPKLLKNKCSLALLSSLWADGRIVGAEPDAEDAVTREELTDEQAQELRRIYEALKEYAIPAFVDRSGEEPAPEGAAVWEALYQELFVPAEDAEKAS